MLSHTTNFSSTQSFGRSVRIAPPAASHELTDALEMMGASMSYARNAEIYGENEPTEYLYKLISGTVRTSKILTDGRRQIGEFYLPGYLGETRLAASIHFLPKPSPTLKSSLSSAAPSKRLPHETTTWPVNCGR